MAGTTFDTRRAQMFPRLEPAEIDRLRRFGQVVHAEPGAALATAGVASPGLFVILAGRVAISRRDAHDESQPIVEHAAGQFVGEIAQLSGRPSLVDVKALTQVEALLIAPLHRRSAEKLDVDASRLFDEAAGMTDLLGARWLADARDSADTVEDAGYVEHADGDGFRYLRAAGITRRGH